MAKPFYCLGRHDRGKNQTSSVGAFINFADHFFVYSLVGSRRSPSICLAYLNLHLLSKTSSIITAKGELRNKSNRHLSSFAGVSSKMRRYGPRESKRLSLLISRKYSLSRLASSSSSVWPLKAFFYPSAFLSYLGSSSSIFSSLFGPNFFRSFAAYLRCA
jgi:hypothetical protein